LLPIIFSLKDLFLIILYLHFILVLLTFLSFMTLLFFLVFFLQFALLLFLFIFLRLNHLDIPLLSHLFCLILWLGWRRVEHWKFFNRFAENNKHVDESPKK